MSFRFPRRNAPTQKAAGHGEAVHFRTMLEKAPEEAQGRNRENVLALHRGSEAQRRPSFIAEKKQAYIYSCGFLEDASSVRRQMGIRTPGGKLMLGGIAAVAAYALATSDVVLALRNLAIGIGISAALTFFAAHHMWMTSRLIKGEIARSLKKRGFSMVKGRFEESIDRLAQNSDEKTLTFIGVNSHGNKGFVVYGNKIIRYPDLFNLLDRIAGKKILQIVSCESGSSKEALDAHPKKNDYLVISSDNGEVSGTSMVSGEGSHELLKFLNSGSSDLRELAGNWRARGRNKPLIFGFSDMAFQH